MVFLYISKGNFHMVRENLTGTDNLLGILTIIYMIVAALIGILLLRKYFQTHQKEHFALGLTYILLSSGWWGSGTAYLSILIFNLNILDELYLFLGYVFFPFSLITWAYAMSKILYEKQGKKIVAIFALITLTYTIATIMCLILDPLLFAKRTGFFTTQPTDVFAITGFLILLPPLIIAAHFIYRSLKVDKASTKIRGVFLLLAFTCFTIATITDSLLIIDPAGIIIVRVILVLSALLFYWSFFLPKLITNKFDAQEADA